MAVKNFHSGDGGWKKKPLARVDPEKLRKQVLGTYRRG
jgi:hypothetical protein